MNDAVISTLYEEQDDGGSCRPSKSKENVLSPKVKDSRR